MINIEEAAGDLKEYADKFEELKVSYEDKYTAFSESVNALIAAKREGRPDEEEDPEGAAEYDRNIATLVSQAETAKMSIVMFWNKSRRIIQIIKQKWRRVIN